MHLPEWKFWSLRFSRISCTSSRCVQFTKEKFESLCLMNLKYLWVNDKYFIVVEDHIIRANLSNVSGTCDSPTAKIRSSTQNLYLSGMESSSECNNNIPRATQFLGKCIPRQYIIHPKCSQQTSRIVVPRPSNSLFSVSMSKVIFSILGSLKVL